MWHDGFNEDGILELELWTFEEGAVFNKEQSGTGEKAKITFHSQSTYVLL